MSISALGNPQSSYIKIIILVRLSDSHLEVFEVQWVWLHAASLDVSQQIVACSKRAGNKKLFQKEIWASFTPLCWFTRYSHKLLLLLYSRIYIIYDSTTSSCRTPPSIIYIWTFLTEILEIEKKCEYQFG